MKKLIAVAAIAISLFGCKKSATDHAETQDTAPLQKITVAYTYQPQSTLIHVALAKGFFAEEGLDVQSQLYTYGKAALQSLLEHKSDIATVAETPVMFSVLKGEKLFVIANIDASNQNNAIVARTDTGITVVSDLKGKRIGVTPGTTSDFFLDSLLTANLLSRADIQTVAMKPEEMLNAIMAKTIDAACTWNYPLAQIKRQLGTNGAVFFDRDIYTETFNLAAEQNFVLKNPETIKKFLRALIKAEKFVAKNPDAAQVIMSAATNIELDLVRDTWSDFNYYVRLDQTLVITLEDESRWAIKNKLTDQTAMPNFLDYIYVDGLKSTKPDAINIIK